MEGIFFAKLVCENEGKSYEIDARTSDSIALAVRFNCPIYTYEFILSSAGIILEEGDEAIKTESDLTDAFNELDETDEDEDTKEPSIASLSTKELEKALNSALENEEYEKASLIRDELNKRNQN